MTRRPMKNAVRIAGAALVLTSLGGALAGCGGSDSDGGDKADAPKSVSSDAFCEKLSSVYKIAQGTPEDTAAAVKGVKDWAAEMEDLGTPSGMSDDEQAGFEVVMTAFQNVPDDATLEELQAAGSKASKEDAAKATAFSEWASKNCTAPDAPSDDAS